MHVEVFMIILGNSRHATRSFGLLQSMLLVGLVGGVFVRKSLY